MTLRNALAACYLILGSYCSCWVAQHVPAIGGRIERFLTDDTAFYLHIPSTMLLLQTAAKHKVLRTAFEDPELQMLERTREELRKLETQLYSHALGRWFLPEFTPEKLSLILTGDCGLILSKKPKGVDPATDSNDATQRSTRPKAEYNPVIYFRLNGARGALLRMLRVFAPHNIRSSLQDLGGGLMAWSRIRQDNATTMHSEIAHRYRLSTTYNAAQTKDKTPLIRLWLKPRTSNDTQVIQWEGYSIQRPEPMDLFRLHPPPDWVNLDFYLNDDGSFEAKGLWKGKLPEIESARGLIEPGTDSALPPPFEAILPFDLEQAFLRMLCDEIATERGQRRWSERLSKLELLGIDFTRDLWPHLGSTLRLAIEPLPEGSLSRSLILLSLPFSGEAAGREALAQYLGVRYKGVYAEDPPRNAKRPYIRRYHDGIEDRLVLVSSGLSRLTIRLSAQGLALISDAGPLAQTDMAPQLAPEASLFGPRRDKPVLLLHYRGKRLDHAVETLVQLWLEERRDKIGIAKFMAEFPDESAFVNALRKLALYIGELDLSIRALEAGPVDGVVVFKWVPQIPEKTPDTEHLPSSVTPPEAIP